MTLHVGKYKFFKKLKVKLRHMERWLYHASNEGNVVKGHVLATMK
jgi:hypothetical protein